MKQSMIILVSMLLALPGLASEFLVKYKDSGTMKMLTSARSQSLGVFQVKDVHEVGHLLMIEMNSKNQVKTLAALLSNPGIEYVVPNAKVHAFGRASDRVSSEAALREQWHIAKVNAPAAWQKAGNKGNHQVIVAVIDTGVDYKHEALSKNMVPGYDFKGNDADPMDETGSANPGHGTHCAGLIGATGDATDGTSGTSPMVSIMPIRFLGADGSGDLNAAIKSIDYAIEKGANIISASWGATIPRAQAAPLLEAVKRADDAGIIFVAAAANDGKNNDKNEVFPANSGYPNTITVAASTESDSKPSWSNFGKAMVHVASPGENIMSTLPSAKYGNLSGTSMATPIVSGIVAHLKAQDPSLTGAQVRALLQTTGSKVSIETACNCRVDQLAAVDSIMSKKMTVVPAAASMGINESLQLTPIYGQAPFTFTSSNPAVLTVSADGKLNSVAQGVATVTVKDAANVSATSLDFNVGIAASEPPAGQCPLGDQALCDLICSIQPDLPFCKQ